MPSKMSKPFEVGPFTGFRPETVAVLRELAAEQNRDWFLANKARYEADARGPMAALVASLGFALAVRDVPLIGDPKTALFRVNRDVRFSKDKRPYKESVSAVLTRDGTKRSQGLLYLHVEPGAAFAALGFYAVEPDQLAAIRARMIADPERWVRLEAALSEHGHALSTESMAARSPRGIEAPAALNDAIRLKSFTVRLPLTHEQLADPALVDRIADFAVEGLPLLEFGWRALEGLPPR